MFNLLENNDFVEKMKNKEFKSLDSCEIQPKSLIEIEVDDIVGCIRSDLSFVNFYEFITKGFTKKYLLEKKLDDILNSPSKNDYPTVKKLEDKYYFSDGKNRIILAILNNKKTIKVLLCD